MPSVLVLLVALATGYATGTDAQGPPAGKPTADPATDRNRGQAGQVAQAMPSMQGTALDPVGSFAPVLDRVIPAVVTVLVTGETRRGNEMGPRKADGQAPTFPKADRMPFRAGGSGVLIDPANGHILTNHHVVADATTIEVSLSDGRRMPAKLVGQDSGSDLAVLEVPVRGLAGIKVGDSDKVRVGDVVLAVGNPFGLEGTATLGIVSALMRSGIGHEAIEDFMQIDAAINPGNSGGALVNVRGELIAINTAGSADPGRGNGIGFAIPVDLAKAIKAELIAHGRMRRGSIGVAVEDLSRERSKQLAMRVTRGATIVAVSPGGPAQAAGLEVGDIVLEISGKPVRSAAEFETRIASVPVGARLDIGAARGTSEVRRMVTAGDPKAVQMGEPLPAGIGQLAGALVRDIRVGNPLFGRRRGVEVTAVPQSVPAYATGLAAGDVIVEIDGTPVRGQDDLLRLISRTGMQYRVGIVRGEEPAWFRVTR
jgi:serine protease DegQ